MIFIRKQSIITFYKNNVSQANEFHSRSEDGYLSQSSLEE